MATKKSVTSSIEEQGLRGREQQHKASPAVFNVNINVNIGKLEMFGVGKVGEGREQISRLADGVREGISNGGGNNNNRDKPIKAHSHIDKSQLLYNRIRSSSSNDNYSKFSVSSSSIA